MTRSGGGPDWPPTDPDEPFNIRGEKMPPKKPVTIWMIRGARSADGETLSPQTKHTVPAGIAAELISAGKAEVYTAQKSPKKTKKTEE